MRACLAKKTEAVCVRVQVRDKTSERLSIQMEDKENC